MPLVAPAVTRRLPQAYARRRPADRERLQVAAYLIERGAGILRALAGGLSNAEIAAQLWLSPETVKTHVKSILCKLRAVTASVRRQIPEMAPPLPAVTAMRSSRGIAPGQRSRFGHISLTASIRTVFWWLGRGTRGGLGHGISSSPGVRGTFDDLRSRLCRKRGGGRC